MWGSGCDLENWTAGCRWYEEENRKLGRKPVTGKGEREANIVREMREEGQIAWKIFDKASGNHFIFFWNYNIWK